MDRREAKIQTMLDGKLDSIQASMRQKELRIEGQKLFEQSKKEAEKLAEEVFKIPFGKEAEVKDGKVVNFNDKANVNTAVGMISQYVRANPQDAKLGMAKLLRLAISEKGYKVGEQKGLEKAAKQNAAKKAAAMESDTNKSGDDLPNADWSTQRLIEYAETHPDG